MNMQTTASTLLFPRQISAQVQTSEVHKLRRAQVRTSKVRATVMGGAFVVGALCMGGGSAQAGGFATARFGGEQGHPTADSPTAIYYNPAGLALGKGTRIFAEGLFAYRDVSYDRPVGAIHNVGDNQVGTPTDAVSANSGEANARNILVSPFLGVASDLGVKNLGVGVAFFAPFGGQAKWDTNDAFKDNETYPGAVDGVQRWSTMEGSLRALYLSAGAAYHLPGPRLSFGATVSLVAQSLDTLRARNATGTDDLVSANGNLLEGRSQIDVKGNTVAAGLGVIWEASDGLFFGLSYQSQPGFGETTQTGDLNFKFGNSPSDTSNINFTQELPDITRFGVRYQAKSNLELRLSSDYTRWSVFKNQCLMDAEDPNANCTLDDNGGAVAETSGVIVNIPRYWKDTYGARVGATYWLDEDKELAGSLAYDSNAVPDKSIDPSLIDMNKVVGTFGGRFKVSDDLRLSISYSHVVYFKREVAVRERNAMGQDIGFTPPSVVPDHAGTYKQMVGLINAGVEYAF